MSTTSQTFENFEQVVQVNDKLSVRKIFLEQVVQIGDKSDG